MSLSGTQGDHLRVLLQYTHDAIGDVEHFVRRGRCADLIHAQETLEEYGHLITAEERWVPREVLDRSPSYKAFHALVETVEQKLQACDGSRTALSGATPGTAHAAQGRPRWMR